MSCLLIGTVTDLALVMEEHRAAHRIAGLALVQPSMAMLAQVGVGLGGGKVAVLTQHHVDQGASAIDRAIQIPPITTHVSSTYQLRPTLPFRRRRRFSANAGVSLASQSRTAS